jgi:hypothetical protein
MRQRRRERREPHRQEGNPVGQSAAAQEVHDSQCEIESAVTV